MAGGNLRKIAGIAASAAAASSKTKGKAAARAVSGASPNAKTNLVLADIALRTGSLLLRRGIERGILGLGGKSPEAAKAIVKGRTLGESLAGAALARLATASVPGAILVGGGMLAKTLYDRKKRQAEATAQGEAAIDEMEERGREA